MTRPIGRRDFHIGSLWLAASACAAFPLGCVRQASDGLAPGQVARGTPRVWIDCDLAIGLPGLVDPDDGWALLYALRNFPERLVGISLGYGNTEDLDHQEVTARFMLANFRAAREGVDEHEVPIVRGATGPSDRGVSTDATRLLIRALEEGALTVLALGRLTTIATVLAERPDLETRIEALYVNGGRRGSEPARPALDRYAPTLRELRLPDTNFDDDFDSVRSILATRVPLVIVPVEFNQRHPISPEMMSRFRASASEGARYCESYSRTWSRLFRDAGAAGFWPFDVGVMLAYFRPDSVQREVLGALIERFPNDTFRGDATDKDYLTCSSTSSARPVEYIFDAVNRDELVAQMESDLSS